MAAGTSTGNFLECYIGRQLSRGFGCWAIGIMLLGGTRLEPTLTETELDDVFPLSAASSAFA